MRREMCQTRVQTRVVEGLSLLMAALISLRGGHGAFYPFTDSSFGSGSQRVRTAPTSA